MRHYYRFMELEPVMEQEEDSVGDGSPTSSMGSPSLSPPPDAWAQLSGKEYHDSLSNHLLQEHLDLQRAYRLLEVQYRNCDTRASRDLQRLKDALPNQDRLREELQRAKERETALKGEIYDLQEQNELLEFRILELEECHENASIRSVQPETHDVGTEMDIDLGQTSLPIPVPLQIDNDIRNCEMTNDRNCQQDAETSTLVEAKTTSPCQTLASAEPSRRTHEQTIMQADSQTNSELYVAEQHNKCLNTLQEQSNNTASQQKITKEMPHVKSTHTETHTINYPEPESSSFSTNTLTTLSESISCTLCRRFPRRRSFPGSSQLFLADFGVAEGENQRESLRKSKSDGEIKARHSHVQETCRLLEEDVRNSQGETREKGIERRDSKGDDSSSSRNTNLVSVEILAGHGPSSIPNIAVKHTGIQVDIAAGKTFRRDRISSSGVEEQVNTMRSMLNAIYDVLRETRVEVECTNSELREEVQTLETTVQRLTEEVTRRGSKCQGSLQEQVAGMPLVSGPPQVRRSRSLSFSKDCYCCSQDLRPTLEEVISKLQQVMDIIIDYEPTTVDDPSKQDVETKEEIPHLKEREDTYETATTIISTVEMQVEPGITVPADTKNNPVLSRGIREGHTPAAVQTITDVDLAGAPENILKPGTRQEFKAKEKVMLKPPDQTTIDGWKSTKEALDHRSVLHQDGWKPGPVVIEEHQSINSFRESTTQVTRSHVTGMDNAKSLTTLYAGDAAEANYLEPKESDKVLYGNTSQVQGAEDDTFVNQELDPLPEEKTKPVLRRWREQLLVRRDRVQPWRIEMLDFPKRMPSVV